MKKLLIILGILSFLGASLLLLGTFVGIGGTSVALLAEYPLLEVEIGMVVVGVASIVGAIYLPTKTNEAYQPPSFGAQRFGSGMVVDPVPVPELSEEVDDSTADEFEAELREKATRIAGQPWEVIRMYASRDDGPWYLFLCLLNSAGERVTIEVSELHEEYHDYFFLKEGASVTFDFSEESLNTDEGDEDEDPERFVTDYLRVRVPD